VWSAEHAVYDTYDTGFVVEAVATAGQVTVFLFSAPGWPKKHNNVYWDDTELQDLAAPPLSGVPSDVLLTVESPTQQAQMPVSIIATSAFALTNVQVIVSGPAGSLQAQYQGVRQEGALYVWRWQFTPPVDGPYTVTLGADGLQAISRISASRRRRHPSRHSPQLRRCFLHARSSANSSTTARVLLPPTAERTGCRHYRQ
jgi:hypothetical protein